MCLGMQYPGRPCCAPGQVQDLQDHPQHKCLQRARPQASMDACTIGAAFGWPPSGLGRWMDQGDACFGARSHCRIEA